MNAHGSKPCVWMYSEEISPIKVLPLWSHWSWGRGRKFWLCLLTEPCFLDVNLQGCLLSLCYFVTVIKHGVAESKENLEKSFVPWIAFPRGQQRPIKEKEEKNDANVSNMHDTELWSKTRLENYAFHFPTGTEANHCWLPGTCCWPQWDTARQTEHPCTKCMNFLIRST